MKQIIVFLLSTLFCFVLEAQTEIGCCYHNCYGVSLQGAEESLWYVSLCGECQRRFENNNMENLDDNIRNCIYNGLDDFRKKKARIKAEMEALRKRKAEEHARIKAQKEEARKEEEKAARNREIQEQNKKIEAENAKKRAEARRERLKQIAKDNERRREAEIKQRENNIVAPAKQRIDNQTENFHNSVDENNARAGEVKSSNVLAQRAKSNKNNVRVTGSPQIDPELINKPKQEIPCISIGQYEGQDVCKKEDTIIVKSNNKKYLLSSQSLTGGQGDASYYFIPKDAFIIAKDLQGKVLPIGYITTTNQKSNSTLYGEIERFAKNAVGCKFTEFICDKATYDKFLQFCDWQTCKMTNTASVNRWNYTEYEQIIKEDIALNNRIINAKLSEILVQLIGDFTSDKLVKSFEGFDLNTSLQDWIIKTLWNETSQLEKITGVSGDCFSSMVGAISSLKKESNPILETTLGDFMKSNSKEQDLYTTETYRTFKRVWVSGLDAVGDCDKSGAIKKNILYHLLKNAPSAGEAIGLYAANVTIKVSIAPEFKQSINEQIEKANKKNVFINNLKAEFANSMNRNREGCLGYTRIIYDLHSRCTNPYGLDYEQEVLALMRDYVCGEKQIPKCNIISTEGLKAAVKNTQPQAQTNNKITEKCLAIALLEPDGANGLGHAGLILYDSTKGFLYYSHAKENNPKLSKGEKYLDCNTLETKTKMYSEAFYIPISYEILKKMNGAAARSVNREYNLTPFHPIEKGVYGKASNNCLDLLINALEAGGYDIGVVKARNSFEIPVPNIRFELLRKNNSGTTIDINQLCNIVKD